MADELGRFMSGNDTVMWNMEHDARLRGTATTVLLFDESRQPRFRALVMTSGNLSDEPIAIGNREALQRLGRLADFRACWRIVSQVPPLRRCRIQPTQYDKATHYKRHDHCGV